MRLYTHTHTDSLKNKGITLVALVVTIVVLLILSGISISLVLGQNGLITYAKKASRETRDSAVKEKIDMALTSYELEKVNNKDVTFKEYMENSEKSGLKNFKLIDENPCEDIQFIGSIDEKLLIMKKDGSYVLTKSGNLAKENYEDMDTKNEYQYVDGEININCSNYIKVCSKDFIEVDPNKKYYEAVNVKSSNEKATYLIGIFEYDADYNLIVPENVSEVNGSLTYLERDLNYGDTEVYLNNIQGFTGEKDTNKGVIIWNYKNSEGYQYPVQTYSRNIFNNVWDSKDEAFDFENNIIKLKSPWNSNTVSKGTMLSQRETAKTYNYGVGSMVNFTDQYKYRENYLQGSKTIRDEWKDTKFRQGTKYIKILFLINYDSVQDVTTSIKDVIFAECE